MSPSKGAWFKMVLQVVPLVIKMIKPELSPLANTIAESIIKVETETGDDVGSRKLSSVAKTLQPEIKSIDNVTIGDVRKVVSAAVDTVNRIHKAKQKGS